jgi:hypothetical protein
MKYSSLGQRCLRPAVATLKHSLPIAPVSVMMFIATLGAPKPFRPAGILKGCFALLFIAVLGEKLIQAHAWLHLDPIHLHGMPPIFGIP